MAKRKTNKNTKKYKAKIDKRERNKKDKEWSINIKYAYENKCAICKRNDVPLHTHHIIPREIKELRHEPENGIALCPLHHKFSLDISPHRNPLIFYSWFMERYPTSTNILINMFKNLKGEKDGKTI